ncbi:FAD:protein FMN transferase [Solimonas soli]|uniref:FAD:protein FMN transferase n=1 Tax=Solimonas soli TaxID=413479 RepID=UPI00048468F8|nr:FAD:protein FMN transferase [Solimonas soli]
MSAAAQRHVFVPLDLSAMPAPPPLGAGVCRLQGRSMGTSWTVSFVPAPGVGEARALGLIEAELALVIAQMSSWEPASQLSRFNAAPAGSWHLLPAAFCEVLEAALALARDSDGAYDPTAGALVDLWGFGPQPRRTTAPACDDIAAALAVSGWRKLRFDAGQRRARQPGGLRLDLSAIAKGYAVDRVCAALDAAGVEHYLVEAGGELRGRGCKPDGMPWWVTIERPPAAGALPEALIALHGLAIASSGDYRRGFDSDGRRYAHTLDPRSGWPPRDGPSAVTVVHRSCMQADGLATALGVLGVDQGEAYARRHDVAALLVWRDADGRWHERITPALAALLE